MPYKDPLKLKEYRKLYSLRKKEARHARGLISRKKPEKTQEQWDEIFQQERVCAAKYYKNKPYSTYTTVDKLFWAATRRAKDKGIEFTICKEDIVVPTHCPYLGIPLARHRTRGESRRDIATLDRIDPQKGYTKDNIEVMSWLANTMKNNAPPELLIKFAKEVLRRYDDHSV